MPKPYYTVATLAPENSIGYLVKRCGVLMTALAERRFEKTSDVTFTQWIALMSLSGHGTCVSATRLSKDVGHDMGSLTRVVDELERRGLVRRERSRKDRRSVEIAITAAGRRVAEDTKRLIVELLNGLAESFSHQELDTLVSLLQRLWQHLESAAAKDSPEAPTRSAAVGRAPRRSLPRGAV